MIPREPQINANDTAFTRELKAAVIWLMREVKRVRIRGDGVSFKVTEMPTGLIGEALYVDAEDNVPPTQTLTVPVKITGRTNYNTYTCTVYANGTDAAATATGVTLRILDVATTETIPNNTYLPAWQQYWSGALQYTADVARDY